MKKSISYFLVLFILPLTFISCDSDSSTGPSSDSMVGTWELTGVEMTYEGITFNYSAEEIDMSQTLVLNADGIFTVTTLISGSSEVETGTWALQGENLTLVVEGETMVCLCSLSGSTMRLTFDSGDVIGAETSEQVVLIYTR